MNFTKPKNFFFKVKYAGMDEWFKDAKPSLQEKNPYMNMPYCLYKGQTVTQSNAVLLFIGRIAKLNGATEFEICANEQTLFQAFDLRNDAVALFYAPKDDAKVDAHFSGKLVTHYKKFEGFLKLQSKAFFSFRKNVSVIQLVSKVKILFN